MRRDPIVAGAEAILPAATGRKQQLQSRRPLQLAAALSRPCTTVKGAARGGVARGATPASASARRNSIRASQIRSASDLPSEMIVTEARRATVSKSTRFTKCSSAFVWREVKVKGTAVVLTSLTGTPSTCFPRDVRRSWERVSARVLMRLCPNRIGSLRREGLLRDDGVLSIRMIFGPEERRKSHCSQERVEPRRRRSRDQGRRDLHGRFGQSRGREWSAATPKDATAGEGH
jgi:hypothetical protein